MISNSNADWLLTDDLTTDLSPKKTEVNCKQPLSNVRNFSSRKDRTLQLKNKKAHHRVLRRRRRQGHKLIEISPIDLSSAFEWSFRHNNWTYYRLCSFIHIQCWYVLVQILLFSCLENAITDCTQINWLTRFVIYENICIFRKTTNY